MRFPRASGILLHPTSLPGPFGIGDLGPAAYEFLDFLISSRQRLWQILPLGPTGYGDSPYSCYSAFAGNTLLISPQLLVDEGYLDEVDIEPRPAFPTGPVDFARVREYKDEVLGLAFQRFKRNKHEDQSAFETFCQINDAWLDDYALFRTLKDAHGGIVWNEWQPSLALRDAAALARVRGELAREIEAHKFYQFLFFKQWLALKSRANHQGIKLIGDVPIFVAYDSADVWTNPDQFKLDKDLKPLVVSGVPPDYFSETGQLWGNPIYNWERMVLDGFDWWLKRIRQTLATVDIIRLDHFRGFAASWEIPAGDKTAKRGVWSNVPGKELFIAIHEAMKEVPIIAEDLGVITPDVEKLRDELKLPGMRVLQFAFGGDPKNTDLPHNYCRNTVAYTGTHDNDTTVGWFNSVAGVGSTRAQSEVERQREFCKRYLNSDGSEIHWDFIRAVWASVADTAIVPLQDLLGLGSEARMNLPNSVSGNWSWRFEAGALSSEIVKRLKDLTQIYGRESSDAR